MHLCYVLYLDACVCTGYAHDGVRCECMHKNMNGLAMITPILLLFSHHMVLCCVCVYMWNCYNSVALFVICCCYFFVNTFEINLVAHLLPLFVAWAPAHTLSLYVMLMPYAVCKKLRIEARAIHTNFFPTAAIYSVFWRRKVICKKFELYDHSSSLSSSAAGVRSRAKKFFPPEKR